MKAREEISLMKRRLEEATMLFKSVREFYGDKMESEEMARFIIEFRKRVNDFKKRQKSRSK